MPTSLSQKSSVWPASTRPEVISLGGSLSDFVNPRAISSVSPPASPAEPTVFEGEKSSALVSGDRLQSLYELHGMCRLLPVRSLRHRPAGDDSGRTAGQLPQRCPACSRICPENAIIFPQHKTPAIAGDPSIGGEMKIDLSQLFGKPSETDLASRERDEHLKMAGRQPVNTAGTIPSSNGVTRTSWMN